MNKFEIPLDQAIKEFYEIEGRYHAIRRFAQLPESIRRRVKDNAAQAHLLAALTEKEKRKIDRAN